MIRVDFSPTTPSSQPVFLLASGHRCGSTLLQRLLNSSSDILIWGEQNGYLNSFMREYQGLLEWQAKVSSHRKTFLLKGYDNFVPNMIPEEYELRGATIAYLGALFGIPAARLGRSTWGFKEVRYGAQVALFLQECFPKARFIHLTRNIIDCFISLKYWEDSPDPWNRRWTEQSIENWQRINASFLSNGDSISNLLSVKYEDVVSDPQGFILKLSRFLDVTPDSFDRAVFGKRLHGTGSGGRLERRKTRPSDLNADERALVSSANIIEIAAAYGYQVEFGDTLKTIL